MTSFYHTEKQPQMDTDKHGLDLISEKIIGCTFEVSSALVSVFLEKGVSECVIDRAKKYGIAGGERKTDRSEL